MLGIVFMVMTTLVADAFADADGTALSAHVIAPTNTISVAWVNTRNTSQILGNSAQRLTGSVDYARATVDCGMADGTVEAVYTNLGTQADNSSGLWVRASDTDTGWLFGQFNSTWVISRFPGNVVVATSAPATITQNVPYALKVVMLGSTLTGYVNGVQVCQYTSATQNQSVTKHGFSLYYSTAPGNPAYTQKINTFDFVGSFPTLEEGLVAFLAADPTLAALITDANGGGIRIYPDMAPQQTPYEYLTYQVIDTVEENSLASNVDFPTARVQVDCWAQEPGGYARALALAKLVKNSQGGVSNGHRLKEFRGNLGGVDVRGCRLESQRHSIEEPGSGGEFPVRRVSLDFLVSYIEV